MIININIIIIIIIIITLILSGVKLIIAWCQGDWIKEGAVVVDCGINVIPGW